VGGIAEEESAYVTSRTNYIALIAIGLVIVLASIHSV
jgi:hypothetical protein